jgi:hypothetical protein
LNPDHKAKSNGDPFNPLFHNQVSLSKDLLPATLDVPALAIACLRVVLHSRTSLAAKLISRRNQAMAGGICAFVRLFDQVSHILPLQEPLSISQDVLLTKKPKKALRFQRWDEFGTARSNA